MTSIEQLIGELLLRHNCVIIPSFGGFVAKKASAKVNFSNGLMTPPSKSLLFNKQLTNNDGLLINELAQNNQISFNDAAKRVSDLTENWNRTLRAGERISLDKVGYLYADSEKNICFEQDRFFNLLLESFGMGQIRFVAEKEVQKEIVNERISAERTTKIEPVVLVKEEEIGSPTTVKIREMKPTVVSTPDQKSVEKTAAIRPIKKQRHPWRYVAAACILPFAFYSIWIPMKTDVLESGVLSINDFNPFHKIEETKYQKEELSSDFVVEKSEASSLEENVTELPEDVKVYTYKYDDDLYIPVSVNESNEDNTNQSSETNSGQESFSSDALNFIVGCFGEESNAVNLVSKLKTEGFDARVVDVKNGLHRVTAGTAVSIESFNKIKSTATSLGYKGWTLK